MALRQMGIARMGPYRPKASAVQEGGKVGRPKLLHNGTGHGLTGGGGLNAKGTGGGIKVNKAMRPLQRQLRKNKYQSNKHNAHAENKRQRDRAKRADEKTRTVGGPPMNPHPVGHFMYGNDQWGVVHKGGQVDWTSTKPRAGKAIIGLNEALPWLKRTPHMTKLAQQFLSARKAEPAVYHDPIYARNMAMAKLNRDNELANLSNQKSQVGHDFDWSLKGLNQDYGESVADQNAALGAYNMADSGHANASLGELASSLQNALKQNEAQKLLADTEISTGESQANTGFSVGKDAEEGMARERWQATHQGQKLPASKNKKIYTEGGITYRTNEHGVPQTWTQKKAAKKPKFPGAKTYKGPNGEVRQIKR